MNTITRFRFILIIAFISKHLNILFRSNQQRRELNELKTKK